MSSISKAEERPRLQEAKETGQVNATSDPTLYSVLEGKSLERILLGQLTKLEQTEIWLKYCIQVKYADVHNCTVVL